MRTGVAIQTSNYDWDNVIFPIEHSFIGLLRSRGLVAPHKYGSSISSICCNGDFLELSKKGISLQPITSSSDWIPSGLDNSFPVM
jgi:hypothetical protein